MPLVPLSMNTYIFKQTSGPTHLHTSILGQETYEFFALQVDGAWLRRQQLLRNIYIHKRRVRVTM